ncbi:MAG: DUF4157 domain-containing protein [Cyclobacteriaceae bacterium]
MLHYKTKQFKKQGNIVQPKLQIGRPDDKYEKEADAVADRVMRMPSSSNNQINPGNQKPGIQMKCDHCEEEEKLQMKPLTKPGSFIQMKPGNGEILAAEGLTSKLNGSKGSGHPLPKHVGTEMSSKIGADFSGVNIHTDSSAIQMSREIGAKAFTYGDDIYFNQGEYAPGSSEGKHLLAHELTHKVQQGNLQRKVIQKANLASPRMAGNTLFEDVLDNRAVIELGDTGPEVRRIQQMLIDLGIFNIPVTGAIGIFDADLEAAVKIFQTRNGLVDDGRVGFRTIGALDRAFPAITLPANVAAPWTMPCILDLLCPWNEHLVENILPTFNIITFDSRTFPVETWDGSTWVTSTFTSGGFRGGTNMGFLNGVSCQEMAFVIYHEGWHGQQPAGLSGVVESERDAYINAEQWSIDIGIPGQGTFTNNATGSTESFRRTSGGETVVNEPAAETFVRQEYGGVSSVPGERILRRVGAIEVRVRRPNGTEYTRPAAVGESVRGAVTMTNMNPIDPANWVCP